MSPFTALFATLADLPAVFALPSSPVQWSRRQNGTNPNDALPGWTSVGCFSFDFVLRLVDEESLTAYVIDFDFDDGADSGAFNFDSDAIDGNGRNLLEWFDIATGVSVESCTVQCEATGLNITGLEFGQDCCEVSSFLVANATAPLTDCSRACEADHTELCGASSSLSVYLKDPLVAPPPQPTTTVVVVPPPTVVPNTTVVPTTVTKVGPLQGLPVPR
ncbi:hypothetical protein BDZ97DRAFT_2081809 [Flammula alnicola]|nr:hypothetical protein BDZ97DRAFT_2081809 [Flammula alnicola]